MNGRNNDTMKRALLPVLAAVVLFPLVAAGADEATPDYSTQIAPLLTKYCAGCHNDDDKEGDFSLASFASLQKGTPGGPALLPGDAPNSRMVRVLMPGADPSMPPEGEPRPSDEEIALLKAWIDTGAIGPDGAEVDRTLLLVPQIESHTDVRPISAVDWSADGKLVAVARYGEVALHQVDDSGKLGEPLRALTGFPGKVNAVHFTPDGARLVTASGVPGLVGCAAIWNVADGALIRDIQGHRDILYDAELSPDGTLLATCSYDRRIILWNATTGAEVRTLEGHNGAVYDVAFSPDGAAVVSASADDTCKVWRVSDGERLDTLGQPTKEQYAVTFSPDGNFIVAGGADNRIRVWRFVSRDKPQINPLLHARFAHEGPIVRLAFTPDGTRLVSVAEDRSVKVWNPADYSVISADEQQPAVAMALAVAGNASSFLLGRMDGSLQTYAIPAAPAAHSGASEAAVADVPMGAVGNMSKSAELEPNNAPAQANRIESPAQVTGIIDQGASGAADSDLFRFAARAGQQWVMEIDAARSKSPLDTIVEVLDGEGDRIERALLQAVRDSYFTFRGKDADTVDDFRVFNWEEMDLNQYLYSNGEVVKLWLYPRGPDSGYMVYPGKGKRWGYFDTTPLAHALGEPCYIVREHAPGSEIIPNGLPIFPVYFENDDDAHRELGADSRLTFTPPADGDYLVRIRDVRGFQGPEYKYTLTIRPRQPDFEVTLHGANPTVNAGSAKEFRVEAKRIDNFEGPIRVDIGGLPPGFHATTPLVIEEGQLEAFGVITANPEAPQPTPENAKATSVSATAEIWNHEVTHDVNNLGEIKLAGKPKVLAAIQPVPGGLQPVGTSSEGWPEYVIHPGETIMLNVVVERSEFSGEVGFGKEGAGRNLPFGSFVDNVGLNGLLILRDQTQREFFVTAVPWVPETTRTFHLNTGVEGGQASWPVVLHVRRAGETAQAARP
jgi:WD40 repeat protein